MSMRPTQTGSGYPRRSRDPFPSAEQAPAGDASPFLAPGPVTLDGPVGGAAGASSRTDRVSMRAARRSRRNLTIACGLLVALCLVITILIVNMARNRPSGLVIVPAARGALGADALPSPIPAVPISGAPAPEGDTR